MTAHWATGYIGAEWSRAQTCWHFCARVWREHFGLVVPLVDIDGSDARAARRAFEGAAERQAWIDVQTPAEGDGVLMAMGARPCHVGIWVDPGGVLHCIEGAGGVFTPRARLSDLGYRVVGFYRRAAT